MKCTAIANSNIALIKYWGKANDRLFLPTNSSLSMTLGGLNSHTTVDFSADYEEDTVNIDGKNMDGEKREKVVRHLNLIRSIANSKLNAKVVSRNNFPSAAGMASSASGFAALTVAACASLGMNLDKKQVSILSRQGSGSSCRSIYGGYVEWIKGKQNEDSYALQLADENYFDIRDIIAIVEQEEKKVSSRAGMTETIKTCPLYSSRVNAAEENLIKIKKAIKEKNFGEIGKISEFDCLLMHATMLTTLPSLIYWSPETIRIIKTVQSWREESLEAYFTIDAGPNVHILSLPENVKEIEGRLRELEGVRNIMSCKIGGDAKITEEHLF
ncbi:MAG: diphosphomevalonate decarboxylase [Candidatus Aenigmatarchaeota archaeon]